MIEAQKVFMACKKIKSESEEIFKLLLFKKAAQKNIIDANRHNSYVLGFQASHLSVLFLIKSSFIKVMSSREIAWEFSSITKSTHIKECK